MTSRFLIIGMMILIGFVGQILSRAEINEKLDKIIAAQKRED